MTLMNELRKRARQILPQIFGLSLALYFAYHLVNGDRGMGAYMRLTQELEEAKANEAVLASEVAAQRALVAGLSAESLDPDLLEERARAVLDMLRSDEVIVILPSQQ